MSKDSKPEKGVRLDLEEGKYSIVQHPSSHTLGKYRQRYEILRHGETWPAAEAQLVGNKFDHNVYDLLFLLKRGAEAIDRIADEKRLAAIDGNPYKILNWVQDMLDLIQLKDPEPWKWHGQRFRDADPAGQDFDFHPKYAPRGPDELARIIEKELGIEL